MNSTNAYSQRSWNSNTETRAEGLGSSTVRTNAEDVCSPNDLQPPPSSSRWRSIDTPPPAESVVSHARFLSVVEQGTVLRKAGSRLLITKKEDRLLDVPAAHLQGVLVFGNVQVSTHCLRELLEEGVWLSFFSRNGIYKGRLQPPHERGGKLRLRQWERSRDTAFCLAFGRAVVRGKILSQRQVAATFAKNYLAETLGEGHRVLRDLLERLDKVAALDELRGVEGAASRAYFELFRRWNRSTFPFEGRIKHPATDPINALLSFAYSLVTRELEGLIESVGFDPVIGFYHVPDGDRPSLACDWVEEFRHPLADRLVLNLVNHSVVAGADFDDRAEKGGLRLSQQGLRKFLAAYEKMMVGPDGFRAIFLTQLGRLLDSINNSTLYQTHLEK